MALLPDLLAHLRIDVSDLRRALGEARERVDEFSDRVNRSALLARNALGGPGGLALGALAVAGAMQPLVGLVGLLPGLFVGAGAAAATLSLGLNGVGEAFANAGDPEKFAEAMGRLAPAAQEFVRSVQGAGPAFTAMRLDVQQTLFQGLGDRVATLARVALPEVRHALVQMAATFNGAAQGFAGFFSESTRVADLRDTILSMNAALGPFLAALGNIGKALLDVAVVGSTFFPSMAQGAESATARFAAFVAEARRTGELAQFIQDGIDAFQDLITVLGAVVKGLTGGLSTFRLAEGALEGLANNAETVETVFRILGPLILAYKAAVLAAAIVSGAMAVAQAGVAAATGAATVASGLATAALRVYIATATFGIGVIHAVRGAVTALYLAMRAHPFVFIVSLIVLLVAALVTLYKNNETVRRIVDQAWAAIRSVIGGVLTWLTTAVPAAFQAVLSAIQTALTAVGAVVTAAWTLYRTTITGALTAISGAVTAGFAAVRGAVSSAMSAIGGAVSAGWSAISGTVSGAVGAVRGTVSGGFSAVRGAVSGAMSAVRSAVSSAFQAAVGAVRSGVSTVVGLVRGLSSSLRGAVSGFGSLLVGAGGDLLRGLASGISGAIGGVVSRAVEAARAVVNGIKGALGISSPSRVMAAEVGKPMAEGVAEGISRNLGLAQDALGGLSGLRVTAPSVVGGGGSVGAAGRGGDTYHVTVPVEVRDLAEVRTVVEFLGSLRLQARRGVAVA